ncbi:MAG TPA: SHOCT domain-containing protein [Methanomassiliicoccales archaeon]|nr:SHOCT domain-containing protein [Methanomassiliicoccales archaeon]
MPSRPDNTLRWVISLVVVAILVILLVGLFVYPPSTWESPTPRYFPFWFFGFFVVLFIIMFLVRILFWGIWGVPRWRYMRYGWYNQQRTPQQVLDDRYARGEITRDQYLQMKDDLMRGRSP